MHQDPGHAVDLAVSSSVRTLVEVWLGHLRLEDALRSQRLVLDGDREMTQSFKKWFTLSSFARPVQPPSLTRDRRLAE